MRQLFLSAAMMLASAVGSVHAAVGIEPRSSLPVSVSEEFRGAPQGVWESKKALVVERFISSAPATLLIEASAVNPASVTSMNAQRKRAAATSDATKRIPLQIGFAREIPSALRTVPLSVVPWQTQADGARAFKVDIAASDAKGIRVAYRFVGPANGAEIRFAGNAREQVFKSDVASSAEVIWSPTLEGDRASIELRVLKGFDPASFSLVLEELMHLTLAGKSLNQKNSDDIGASEDCNIDMACVGNPSQALLDIARATNKISFIDGSKAYVCTGTLINSSPATGVPYVFTAAHCMTTQAAASTVNTYWFFDAVACDALATPPYQLVGGGAALVHRDETMDTALIRMNSAPPNGAVLAAWDATVIPINSPSNTAVVGIHHPAGDLKKFSSGTMQGNVRGPTYCDTAGTQICPTYLRDSYISVRWNQGTTEEGSSGSGLFTFDSSKGYYTLRGALEGGSASCSNRNGLDRYSRLDLVFTKLAPYIQPSAIIPTTNATTASMVEFYNPEYDFYFMTSRETEKSALDNARDNASPSNATWYRTGYWFKTDPFPSAQTSSLTRYFIPGAAKNGTRGSHFYTASNSEKQLVAGTGRERSGSACSGLPNTWFCNEGTDSYIALPVGTLAAASCFAGEKPIYRAFRGAPNFNDDGNHRYLSNAGMYDYMTRDLRWTPEYVAFCAKP